MARNPHSFACSNDFINSWMKMHCLVPMESEKPSKDSILLGKLIFPVFNRVVLAPRPFGDKLRVAVAVLQSGKGVTGGLGKLNSQSRDRLHRLNLLYRTVTVI